MSKLFGLNKPNTNLRKNVFDLSEKVLFSTSAGLLTPCMVKEMNPSEKIQISMSAITRTQPLNTAAFVRCRQYYHFFFVPFKQLWSGWDNFINGVDYRTSSLQSKAGYKRVPALDLIRAFSALIKASKLISAPPVAGTSTVSGASTTSASIPPSAVPESLKDLDKKDEFGVYYYRGISRLLDMLGYGISTMQSDKINSFADLIDNYLLTMDNRGFNTSLNHLESKSFKVNPFRLLAYQKIYNDFYKRDDYEATNPANFNIDDLDGSKDFPLTDADRLLNLFQLRYRWLPKDYFTGVVPSELFGVGGALRAISSDGYNLSFSNQGTNTPLAGAMVDDRNVSVQLKTTNGKDTITTRSIRAAFAIEKLLRLTRRAGGFDYISQTSAHYGFEPPKGRGDKVEFIGGFSENINISEVLTTADSGERKVGDIAGRGVGSFSDNKEIEYQAKEHGLIMCITSIVPESDYNAVGLNRFNTKFDRGDYFHPEFQDLGMQPTYGYELRNGFFDATSYENTSSSGYSGTPSAILGFSPAYSEYKTAYDSLHGEFRDGRMLSAWSSSMLVKYGNGVTPSTLKVNPKALNRIFALHFDGSEITDQFLINAQFIVKAIRPMSITGQNL